jgi:cysteine desulfurase
MSELPQSGAAPQSEWPVYLDNAATTPLDPRVAARMSQALCSDAEFGNPASRHRYGDAAAAAIETARAQVAAAVGAEPDEVIFTSGATESNNLAIFGVAHYYRGQGRHIVTARTEHKAVLDPCAELERRGWRVTYLEPREDGIIEPAQLAAVLRPDTALVSLMHVNNEIGVIHDIAALAAVCAEHGTWLHVDAAQSVGKCGVDFAGCGAHLMSLSAHKVYGPKGAGALLLSKRAASKTAGAHSLGGARVHLSALHLGGGQEGGLRSGTLATHQIVGMGLAFQLAAEIWGAESRRITDLRDRLWRGLAQIGGVLRNGAPPHVVPNLLNVSFEGVEGESLLAAVSPRIAVSTGSACSSATQEPSYVLRALGRSEILSESSLRFSLGRFTVEGDVDAAIAVVSEAVRRLRRVAGTSGSARNAAAA